MSSFELTKQLNGQFALSGIINKKTVANIWAKRKLLQPKDGSIAIDLKGITKSDSAGLALLICLKKEALSSKFLLTFTNTPEQLQQLIQLSHLEDILKAGQGL